MTAAVRTASGTYAVDLEAEEVPDYDVVSELLALDPPTSVRYSCDTAS